MSEEAAVRREVAPMNLLIVDDELAIRETCAVVAEQCGMRATGVATAEEALDVLDPAKVVGLVFNGDDHPLSRSYSYSYQPYAAEPYGNGRPALWRSTFTTLGRLTRRLSTRANGAR